MKSFSLTFITIFLSCLLHGQSIKINDRFILDGAKSPSIWIDTLQTDLKHLVMDKAAIDSLTMVKDSLVDKRYRHLFATGSLVLYPKPGVELVRLPVLLERLGVPPADRNRKVCINKTLIQHPPFLLIQPDYIKTIEVTPDRHWTYPDEANGNELYLNLITKESKNQ